MQVKFTKTIPEKKTQLIDFLFTSLALNAYRIFVYLFIYLF